MILPPYNTHSVPGPFDRDHLFHHKSTVIQILSPSVLQASFTSAHTTRFFREKKVGIDRLSAPILGILTHIGISLYF